MQAACTVSLESARLCHSCALTHHLFFFINYIRIIYLTYVCSDGTFSKVGPLMPPLGVRSLGSQAPDLQSIRTSE